MSNMSQLNRTRVRSAWLFLLPMLLVLFIVAAWPLAHTFWFSLTDANLAYLSEARFIGWENYLVKEEGEWFGLLVDFTWWHAVWNTLFFTVVSVFLETVLGLIIALTLHAKFFGRSVLRAAVLIPWAIPTIVSAQMWAWMYNDQFGMINDLLLKFGLIAAPIAWTADPDFSMAAIIFADVWKTTPFMALLILAALQMLPTHCYEAAKLDGIHPITVFFEVTLPLIKPALVVAVIFRALDALRVFDLIYVLTSNTETTMSMSVYVRMQMIDFQEIGYGSAAATLLFAIIAVLTGLYLVATRVKLDEGVQA